MLAALARWLAGGMQRKAEKDQPAHAGQRFDRLRLRGHAAAERLAAGDERQLRHEPRRLRDGGADGHVRELGRVGPSATLLHVGKLVAQGRDAAIGKLGRDGRHERMVHARAGAVRQHVAGARTRRDEQQAGDALGVADRDANRFCV